MNWRMTLVIGCLLAGCTTKKNVSKLSATYSFAVEDSADWLSVDPGSADLAWWNQNLSSTIYADSHCGAQFEDSTLERLAQHLTAGLDDVEEVHRADLSVANRAALLRVVQGKLDGVEVNIGAVVFKRNECNFDLLFVAPPRHYDAGQDTFMRAVSNFTPTEKG